MFLICLYVYIYNKNKEIAYNNSILQFLLHLMNLNQHPMFLKLITKYLHYNTLNYYLQTIILTKEINKNQNTYKYIIEKKKDIHIKLGFLHLELNTEYGNILNV